MVTLFGYTEGHTVTPEAVSIMKKYEDSQMCGGTVSYKGLTGKDAQRLLEIRAAQPKDQQNDAPTFKELADVAVVTGCTLHGYRVVPEREDERITAEGIEGTVSSEDFLGIIAPMCKNADEMDYERKDDKVSFRAWWD